MQTTITRPLSHISRPDTWLFHTANMLYLIILVVLRVLTQNGHSLPLDWFDPGVAAIMAQIGFFLLPTLAFVWLTHQSAQVTLKLNRPTLGIAVRCLLIGFLSWAGFLFLCNLTGALLVSLCLRPTGQTIDAMVSGGAPWSAFIAVALAAPLCEEVLFRGALLSAYEERTNIHAVWMIALLFATMHLNVVQVLGALFLGLVAGWVVYHTRSIWAGVLVHLGTNLISALLTLVVTLRAPITNISATQGASGSILWTVALVWGGITVVALVPLYVLLKGIDQRYPAPAHAATHLDFQTLWSFALVLLSSIGFILYDVLH